MMTPLNMILISGIWLYFSILLTLANDSEGQTPVGAYRVFPKTSFSCLGRPSGYYADIETGCQVYHMCDGLGRQFSYSCPNTTLFQQRMLICDHWYMVNCSRAESDYDANLLIGQRDKPFVSENEHHQRTPRPDLLDRPYAADYLGESFRNQYKNLPALQNQIFEKSEDKSTNGKRNFQMPTRWRIQQSTRDDSEQQPSTVTVSTLSRKKSAINRRSDVVDDNTSIDFGTSFSLNSNTSGDFSAEQNTFEKTTVPNIMAETLRKVKVPSKIYEPPFLKPIWNANYTETLTELPSSENSEPSTTSYPTTTTIFRTTTTTKSPRPAVTRPPKFITQTLPPATFVTSTRPSTTDTPKVVTTDATTVPDETAQQFLRFGDRQIPQGFRTPQTERPIPAGFSHPTERNKPQAEYRTPPTTLIAPPAPIGKRIKPSSFTTATPTKSSVDETTFTNTAQSTDVGIELPSKILQPPFLEYVTHDVATTQGPPIYFEWKIPSDGLEPPKFGPPIGVDGRVEEDSYQSINTSDITFTTTENTNNDFTFQFSHNPGRSLTQQGFESSTKSPTPRSIQERRPKSNTTPQDDKTTSSEPPTIEDIHRLQRQFLIPDFLFPLEDEGRTGYEHTDTFNSFQLKIPERRSDDQKWYGENDKCPECHPSFLKPGTCEPCIKRR